RNLAREARRVSFDTVRARCDVLDRSAAGIVRNDCGYEMIIVRLVDCDPRAGNSVGVRIGDVDGDVRRQAGDGKKTAKKSQRNVPQGNPPLHASGIVVNGSRRSPGLRSAPARRGLAHLPIPARRDSGSYGPILRLQLRGSAGFSPASQRAPTNPTPGFVGTRKNNANRLNCEWPNTAREKL